MKTLMKTKEKQFSIPYKFALGGIGNLACPERMRRAGTLNRAKGSAPPPNISVRLFFCAFMQNLIASQRNINNRRK
jgi:hypothetical protein